MTGRYKTEADRCAIVRVRAGCGHFDTLTVRHGEFITIDGVFTLCQSCQDHAPFDGDSATEARVTPPRK